jgi:TatD DNase family protein
MMIDTHCHLSLEDADAIKNMKNNIMIVSGANMEMNKEVLKLIDKYDNIYGTIGFHPGDLGDYNDDNLKWLKENAKHKKIVAIGEIGLDYYYGKENKILQQEAFINQIKIAQKINKPIVVHMREATEDTLRILKENKIKSVIHCFSGSVETAKEFIKLGSYLGVGGVVTFKNSKNLKEVVKEISIENLLLETDSPYLSPEPFRSQKNEPKNIEIIAQKIAEIKGVKIEFIFEKTTKNAAKIFDLNIPL